MALLRVRGASSKCRDSKESARNEGHTSRLRHGRHDPGLFLRREGGAIPVYTHENLKAAEVEIGRVRTLRKSQQVGGLSSHRPAAIDDEAVCPGNVRSE